MISKRSLILSLGALGIVAALGTASVVYAQSPAPTPAVAQGWGPCPWGGPGMQQGWGPGPGMQQGWGGGPGMMQGWGGGPGMQQGWGPGPGMQQGWGPGQWGGPGMMQGRGPRHGMMAARGQGRGGVAPWAADGNVTVDEVKQLMDWRLARRNNPNLKVGKIEAKDDATIVAEIVTKEGSLVRQFEVDRKTGKFRPLP